MERTILEQFSKSELIEIVLRLDGQVAALEARCAKLEKVNAELTARCTKLEKENAELTTELAKARKNSANSSKPPSSDIVKPAKPNPPNGKPGRIGGQPGHPMHARPLVRMGEVLAGRPGDTSLVAACDFFISPLILDPNQAACFVEKRRFGIANVPGTMPVAGISSPVTIAGTVVVALAELMAGWVLGYLVNPGLPAGGIVSTGSLDMRTLAACFGSPEAMLQDVSVVNLCRRLYGIPVHAAVGYTDCKRPGLEAVFLKMFPLVGIPFGTDQRMGGGGLLSAGQDYSPVQHMLDSEMEKAVERFWGNYEVSEDTLAVELTEQIMRASATNFLDTEHTFRHYAAEQWYPRWFDRTRWQSDEYERSAEAKMLERIDRCCKDAIAGYQPPDVDPAKVAELKRIFLAAEKQILGSNVTCL